MSRERGSRFVRQISYEVGWRRAVSSEHLRKAGRKKEIAVSTQRGVGDRRDRARLRMMRDAERLHSQRADGVIG
jgi:hypothetical protein